MAVQSLDRAAPVCGLDSLAQRPTAPVIVTEGEKAADAATKLLPDYVVVTSPNGAKAASKADWSVLRGRDVTIWPDNDDGGRAYAADAAKALRGIAKSVRIVASTSGTPDKWDAADALPEGCDRAKIEKLIAAAVPADPSASVRPDAPSGRGERSGRPRQSDHLLNFLSEVELWHSPDREAYATVSVDGHFENWLVRSRDFREWLSAAISRRPRRPPAARLSRMRCGFTRVTPSTKARYTNCSCASASMMVRSISISAMRNGARSR